MPDDAYWIWLSGWAADGRIWEDPIRRRPRGTHRTVDFADCRSAEQLVKAALDALPPAGGRKAVLVGWSLGAMVALELACLRPGKVHALYLIGASGKFVRSDESPHGAAKRAVRRMKSKLAEDLPAVLRDFDGGLFAPAEAASPYRESWNRWRETGSWSRASLEAGLDYLLQFDFLPKAPSLQTPVYLLSGRDDAVCPWQGAEQLARALPQARLSVWDGAGHAPFWTDPGRFDEWIKGNEPHALSARENQTTI